MNARRKQELLKLEAEHLENARFLNRADVVVMTESDEDERFWRAVFNHAVPNLKIMFNCDTYLSLVITFLFRPVIIRYFPLRVLLRLGSISSSAIG